MNAIEIKDLSNSFRGMYAVDHLCMTVPQGAIYGFIGENGSGKSTTEKLICGHLVQDGGQIKLFGRDYTDPGVCSLTIVLPMAVVNLFLNVLPTLALRYNTPMLISLLKRLNRKETLRVN